MKRKKKHSVDLCYCSIEQFQKGIDFIKETDAILDEEVFVHLKRVCSFLFFCVKNDNFDVFSNIQRTKENTTKQNNQQSKDKPKSEDKTEDDKSKDKTEDDKSKDKIQSKFQFNDSIENIDKKEKKKTIENFVLFEGDKSKENEIIENYELKPHDYIIIRHINRLLLNTLIENYVGYTWLCLALSEYLINLDDFVKEEGERKKKQMKRIDKKGYNSKHIMTDLEEKKSLYAAIEEIDHLTKEMKTSIKIKSHKDISKENTINKEILDINYENYLLCYYGKHLNQMRKNKQTNNEEKEEENYKEEKYKEEKYKEEEEEEKYDDDLNDEDSCSDEWVFKDNYDDESEENEEAENILKEKNLEDININIDLEKNIQEEESSFCDYKNDSPFTFNANNEEADSEVSIRNRFIKKKKRKNDIETLGINTWNRKHKEEMQISSSENDYTKRSDKKKKKEKKKKKRKKKKKHLFSSEENIKYDKESNIYDIKENHGENNLIEDYYFFDKSNISNDSFNDIKMEIRESEKEDSINKYQMNKKKRHLYQLYKALCHFLATKYETNKLLKYMDEYRDMYCWKPPPFYWKILKSKYVSKEVLKLYETRFLDPFLSCLYEDFINKYYLDNKESSSNSNSNLNAYDSSSKKSKNYNSNDNNIDETYSNYCPSDINIARKKSENSSKHITTYTSNFNVFTLRVSEEIQKFLLLDQPENEKDILDICKDLCISENSYIYAQLILEYTYRNNNDSSMRKLSQYLCLYILYEDVNIYKICNNYFSNVSEKEVSISYLIFKMNNLHNYTALYNIFKNIYMKRNKGHMNISGSDIISLYNAIIRVLKIFNDKKLLLFDSSYMFDFRNLNRMIKHKQKSKKLNIKNNTKKCQKEISSSYDELSLGTLNTISGKSISLSLPISEKGEQDIYEILDEKKEKEKEKEKEKKKEKKKRKREIVESQNNAKDDENNEDEEEEVEYKREEECEREEEEEKEKEKEKEETEEETEGETETETETETKTKTETKTGSETESESESESETGSETEETEEEAENYEYEKEDVEEERKEEEKKNKETNKKIENINIGNDIKIFETPFCDNIKKKKKKKSSEHSEFVLPSASQYGDENFHYEKEFLRINIYAEKIPLIHLRDIIFLNNIIYIYVSDNNLFNNDLYKIYAKILIFLTTFSPYEYVYNYYYSCFLKKKNKENNNYCSSFFRVFDDNIFFNQRKRKKKKKKRKKKRKKKTTIEVLLSEKEDGSKKKGYASNVINKELKNKDIFYTVVKSNKDSDTKSILKKRCFLNTKHSLSSNNKENNIEENIPVENEEIKKTDNYYNYGFFNYEKNECNIKKRKSDSHASYSLNNYMGNENIEVGGTLINKNVKSANSSNDDNIFFKENKTEEPNEADKMKYEFVNNLNFYDIYSNTLNKKSNEQNKIDNAVASHVDESSMKGKECTLNRCINLSSTNLDINALKEKDDIEGKKDFSNNENTDLFELKTEVKSIDEIKSSVFKNVKTKKKLKTNKINKKKKHFFYKLFYKFREKYNIFIKYIQNEIFSIYKIIHGSNPDAIKDKLLLNKITSNISASIIYKYAYNHIFEYVNSSRVNLIYPKFILLICIINKYPQKRFLVMYFLKELYIFIVEKKESLEEYAELRKNIILFFVYIVRFDNMFCYVLDIIKSMIYLLDKSLIRLFIMEILSYCAPPYNVKFCRALLHFIYIVLKIGGIFYKNEFKNKINNFLQENIEMHETYRNEETKQLWTLSNYIKQQMIKSEQETDIY